ncbi:sigma-54-dependent transcriptional regulator [Nitrogeniibacter aestuarii]|uniref:sigma-54-dependent transcriptional regulator n=1 Tax=Nitrogeniibacter aestuarii TaxID=2815343 RepID=UPI001E5A3B6F|nr:sigma-54 dependent transcriptional regulator [Nitrogeniibacter aestuarii]
MSTNDRRQGPRGADVLVVDDEEDIRELLEMTLIRMGLGSHSAGSVADARALLDENEYRLCLTDMRLPDGDGLALVRHISEHCADLPVAVITAYGSMENAVVALKAGAFDYLAKPVSLEQLRALVKSVFRLPTQGKDAGEKDASAFLIGESGAMEQVRKLIEKLARSQAPVYISGESGSGKERAARAIHGLGPRADSAFVAVNCGAIPDNLMESEFFGYRKGAFTGADKDHDGFFHAAHGGTLFLDEVADLPLSMQVKLLRVIQEKRVRRIGETEETPVDVRIVSATHQNLKQLVDDQRFRQDLFYRLNVIELKMPALRERKEDIPALADALLSRLAEQAGLPIPRLSTQATQALAAYGFPGNVRELENTLERALALCGDDIIHVEDLALDPVLPADTDLTSAESGFDGSQALRDGLQEYLDEAERQAILEALGRTDGNRTAAARLLKVTFRSLRYRMERLGMKE